MIVRRVWPGRPTFDAPWADFDQLRRDLLHTFDVFAGDREQRTSPSGVFPPINVTQDADRFYVRAELPGVVVADMPGVKPDQLEIDLRENVLTLTGRVTAAPANETDVLREYDAGTFFRRFTLAEIIDQANIDAKLADGVLRLELPKLERAKPRQITVRTG